VCQAWQLISFAIAVGGLMPLKYGSIRISQWIYNTEKLFLINRIDENE
jgi:hypothetical protein